MKKLLKGIFALVLAASAITCVPVTKAEENVDITDGLVGHYTFEGDTVDSAVANTLTVDGAIGSLVPHNSNNLVLESVTSGDREHKSIKFNASADLQMIVDANDSGLYSPTSDYSVSMWYNVTSDDPSFLHQINTTATPSSNAGGRSTVIYNSSKYFHTFIDNKDGYYRKNGLNVTLEKSVWKHITFVYSGSTATTYLYMDGQALDSTNVNTGAVVKTLSIVLGRHKGGGNVFLGQMDDIRFYNKAVSADVAKAIYDSTYADYYATEVVVDPTANAYFYDGKTNSASNEGENNTVAAILDDSTDTYWHSGYLTGNGLPSDDYLENSGLNNSTEVSVELQKPMYILVNLGQETEFDQFTYVNRINSLNGVVTGINLYANMTDSEITITESAGQAIDLTSWTKVTSAQLAPESNTIDMSSTTTTSQVLIEITHVLPNWEGKLVAACAGFGVAKRAEGAEMTTPSAFADILWDKVPVANADGYLLDSYYSAMVLNEPAKDTAVAMAENTYARYVSTSVGAVQAQGKTVGETYKLRFVSSVASLNPDAAGFEVSVNGGDVTDVPSNTVFTAIQEKDGTAVTTSTAAEVFGNSASRYFTTFTISGVPTTQGDAIVTVKPYWIPHGLSEKVYGTTRTFTVSEIMSAAN